MLTWMRKRLSNDGGFTLIELMVVVLIIAVLVAIAIPSFIGFRNRAQDRSAQSELRNVLLAEQAYWTDSVGGTYTAVEADLKSFEPSIVLNADPTVAVDVGAGTSAVDGEDYACLERTSDSGTMFAIWVGDIEGTFYGEAACNASGDAPPATFSQGGW